MRPFITRFVLLSLFCSSYLEANIYEDRLTQATVKIHCNTSQGSGLILEKTEGFFVRKKKYYLQTAAHVVKSLSLFYFIDDEYHSIQIVRNKVKFFRNSEKVLIPLENPPEELRKIAYPFKGYSLPRKSEDTTSAGFPMWVDGTKALFFERATGRIQGARRPATILGNFTYQTYEFYDGTKWGVNKNFHSIVAGASGGAVIRPSTGEILGVISIAGDIQTLYDLLSHTGKVISVLGVSP